MSSLQLAAVVVWRCEKCGAQKEPRAMEPHIPRDERDMAVWLWINGGMVHGCSTQPTGEAQVITQQFPGGVLVPLYGYTECRMDVLLGEEAEEWVSLRNSLSEEKQG